MRCGASTSSACLFSLAPGGRGWNSGGEGGKGSQANKQGCRYRDRRKQDVRSKIVMALEDSTGVPVGLHHHEVATAGSQDRYALWDARQADSVRSPSTLVKNVARRNGQPPFMPKPLFGDNEIRMHATQNLWRGENNVFDESGYAQLGRQVLHRWPAGPRAGAPGDCGTNYGSYRRLVPGFEAPVNLAPTHSATSRPSAASQ